MGLGGCRGFRRMRCVYGKGQTRERDVFELGETK